MVKRLRARDIRVIVFDPEIPADFYLMLRPMPRSRPSSPTRSRQRLSRSRLPGQLRSRGHRSNHRFPQVLRAAGVERRMDAVVANDLAPKLVGKSAFPRRNSPPFGTPLFFSVSYCFFIYNRNAEPKP